LWIDCFSPEKKNFTMALVWIGMKDLHAIPIEQLRKVHKVFIDSTTGSTARVGIAIDPALD
jgi:hypothetical protein